MNLYKSVNKEMSRVLKGLKHGFCTMNTLKTIGALLTNSMFKMKELYLIGQHPWLVLYNGNL